MSGRLPEHDDQAALAEALQAVRARLQSILEDPSTADKSMEVPIAGGSSLQRIGTVFDLSRFETSLLLMAAAVELLPGFDELCAAVTGATDRLFPTFGLGLAVFTDSHWSALLPGGPLRRHRLIQLGDGDVLTQRPIRIEERVLHGLLGENGLDPSLQAHALKRDDPGALPPSHEAVARSLMGHDGLIDLWGDDLDAAVDVGTRAAALDGRPTWVIDSVSIAAEASAREDLARLWTRELRLSPTSLVVAHGGGTSTVGESAVVDFLRRVDGPRVLVAREAVSIHGALRRRVDPLPFEERLHLWREALSGDGPSSEGLLRDVSAQFSLGPSAIRSVAAELRDSNASNGREDRNALWHACRGHARPRMTELAQRVEVRSRLDRLVLPDAQREMLSALVGQVRRRATVHHGWGFADIDERSGGTSAVFSGPSGTGKTMAAEAIAAELDLDLYRIDLSAVVSKYIGETEENLRRVFDAAEAGGAILLFDEADALFGKRTEVRDSHDRHANIEVSYLLQRMEAYGGLAILTTNLRKSMDDAFLRRVQFIVEFPFPDARQREEIWRSIFPRATPRQDLDYPTLARLSVTGGNIRSIARNAAYLAADQEQSVAMSHLLAAARLEYAKLGKSLAPSEVRGWE